MGATPTRAACRRGKTRCRHETRPRARSLDPDGRPARRARPVWRPPRLVIRQARWTRFSSGGVASRCMTSSFMGRPLPYPTQLSPTKRIPVILKPRLQLAILPQLVLHRCSTWSRCLRRGSGGKRRVRVAGAGQAGASRARVLRGEARGSDKRPRRRRRPRRFTDAQGRGVRTPDKLRA